VPNTKTEDDVEDTVKELESVTDVQLSQDGTYSPLVLLSTTDNNVEGEKDSNVEESIETESISPLLSLLEFLLSS